MANVLNRATKQCLHSVHEPNYPVQDWIINPDLAAVSSLSTKYWLISGDTVSLMDQAARDAVDAAELQSRRDATADEFNAHAAKINSMLSAMDASTTLADMKTRIGAIADYPPRTSEQLITAIRNKLGS